MLGSQAWSIWAGGKGAWIALKPATTVSSLYLTFNDAWGTWSDSIAASTSCKSGSETHPRNYTILTSANSTDGSDGAWDTAETITGSLVSARAHVVPFTGKTWVKLFILGDTARLNEIRLYDGNTLGNDSWLFMGNSITAMTFKSYSVDTSFSQQLLALDANRDPAFMRGGISCIKSTDVAADVSKYLKFGGTAKRWAIELGTNDGWNNGTYNLPAFKASLQTIIDSAKAHGITPMIARVMATDSSITKWQINIGYPLTVDSLAAANNLPAGPDFYAWFKAHPSELNSDGVHPNAVGAASIQRLWAQAALKVSPTVGTVQVAQNNLRNRRASLPGRSVMYFDVAGRLQVDSRSLYQQKTGVQK